jgi:hypothetical protein
MASLFDERVLPLAESVARLTHARFETLAHGMQTLAAIMSSRGDQLLCVVQQLPKILRGPLAGHL